MFPMSAETRTRNPQRRRVSTPVSSWTNFSPLTFNGLTLWLDAADTSTITESSGKVSQWNDKSTNGFNVTQATSSSQPVTNSRTMNGKNVLDFTPSQFMQTSGNVQLVDSSSGAYTVIATFLTDTVTGIGGIISQDVTARRLFQMLRRNATALETVRVAGGVFVDGAGVTLSASTSYIAAGMQRPTNIEAWVGGVSNGPATTTGTNGNQANVVLVGNTFTGDAFFFDGVIAELLVYNRNLSLNELWVTGRYLATKWNAQWIF